MSIASLSDLARALPSAVERNRGNQIGDLVRVSATKPAKESSASAEVALLSQALGLQSQTSAIRAASTNVAKASAVLNVADEGLKGIEEGLSVLTQIATLAARDDVTDGERQALQKQANEVLEGMQKLAQRTNFNGTNLLDGSLKPGSDIGTNNSEELGLQLNDYRLDSLFKGATIDVTSKANAVSALKTLAPAGIEIGTARASVINLRQQFDIAGAALESALQNQEAARSSLLDSDANANSLLNILLSDKQSGVALLAQSNKLQPSVLNLLNS